MVKEDLRSPANRPGLGSPQQLNPFMLMAYLLPELLLPQIEIVAGAEGVKASKFLRGRL